MPLLTDYDRFRPIRPGDLTSGPPAPGTAACLRCGRELVGPISRRTVVEHDQFDRARYAMALARAKRDRRRPISFNSDF